MSVVALLSETGALEQRLGVGVPPHEITEELLGGLGISLAQDAFPKGKTGLRVHDSFLLKTGEGIRIQYL